MIIKENRTESYLATVDLKDETDLQFVESTRNIVKEMNRFLKSKGSPLRQYVKIQGRGHRMGNQRYNQSLPLKYATTGDVYIYSR